MADGALMWDDKKKISNPRTIPVKRPKPEAAAVNPAISRAMFHLKAATPLAEADPNRPAFHFHPPAQWMNGPAAALSFDGWRHLFYQFNPYADSPGETHWGHARSRDLVHWEHMPIALFPSAEKGEEQCLSGCAVMNGENKPMIFYTSGGKDPDAGERFEQWAATGDSQFMVWKKHPANPVLTRSLCGGLSLKEWRDPFVFAENGRTFMITGGKLDEKDGGDAAVLMHEADNKELTKWTYKGVLFRHPSKDLSGIERPNLFKLDGKHLLLISSGDQVEYFVGAFDPAAPAFAPEKRGVIDISENFHSAAVFKDENGRAVVVGAIRGFRQNRGWNGCLSLPRAVSLDFGGSLLQEPIQELRKLRGNYAKLPPFMLNRASHVLQDVRGDMLDLVIEFEPRNVESFGVKLRRSDDGKRAATISWKDGVLDAAGASAPVKLDASGVLSLRLLLDKSVLEVFAQSRVCVTRVVYSDPRDLGIEIFAGSGDLTIRNVEAWAMRLAT